MVKLSAKSAFDSQKYFISLYLSLILEMKAMSMYLYRHPLVFHTCYVSLPPPPHLLPLSLSHNVQKTFRKTDLLAPALVSKCCLIHTLPLPFPSLHTTFSPCVRRDIPMEVQGKNMSGSRPKSSSKCASTYSKHSKFHLLELSGRTSLSPKPLKDMHHRGELFWRCIFPETSLILLELSNPFVLSNLPAPNSSRCIGKESGEQVQIYKCLRGKQVVLSSQLFRSFLLGV